MKDLIKRIVIGIISGALLGYLGFLFVGKAVIVDSAFVANNTLYFIVLAVICLILFIFFAVYPVHFKMTKGTLFVIGIGLIFVSKTVLVNDITKNIYIGDLFALLGVILTLLARTNVLITDKIRKQKADKKVNIIEV